MLLAWSWLRRYSLHLWAILIAFALWFQVHGQGDGSLSMDVPLQVQGLSADMVIVNDLPDHARVTIKGLQSRLKEVHGELLYVPLNASGITAPGVLERSLRVGDISLPVGLRVEKIQPDHVQLQVDRIILRSVPVRANLELPERWAAEDISVEPAQVQLIGPEVWLDAMREVRTNPISLELKEGQFQVQAGVESPSGKAIRLADSRTRFEVTGKLNYVNPAEAASEAMKMPSEGGPVKPGKPKLDSDKPVANEANPVQANGNFSTVEAISEAEPAEKALVPEENNQSKEGAQ